MKKLAIAAIAAVGLGATAWSVGAADQQFVSIGTGGVTRSRYCSLRC